jgi:hypothetical protein
MGKDGQPKHRQDAREIRRKKAKRGPYERVLIVCEGEKTEPNYFNELRTYYRLQTANVMVRYSQLGTSPIQVAQYAEQLFKEGDTHHKLAAREFERVYVLFDRDDHESYNEALDYCAQLSQRLKNTERETVPFIAVPSVPCFELWLLLHYEDVLAPLHRDEVCERLKTHLPDYEKGLKGIWKRTAAGRFDAQRRALDLMQRHSSADGVLPCTAVVELVDYLSQLKSSS